MCHSLQPPSVPDFVEMKFDRPCYWIKNKPGFQFDACSMSPKGGGESDQSEGDVSSKHLMENAFNPVPFCLFSFYCDQFETPKFVL